MNKISESKIRTIQQEKQKLGLLYGILAGIGFALTGWGLDAAQLAQASAYLPWGKFVVGCLACIILGGLAGWVSSRLDNGLPAALIWIATAITVTIGMGWLAYQGVVNLLARFYPNIASLLSYSLNPAIEIRTGIAAIVSGLLGIAVSIVQLNQLDSAMVSTHPLQRIFNLAGGMVVFAIAGLIANGLIQANLRDPLVQVDTALKYGAEHRGQTLEIHEAREHGQTAIRALGELQYSPYRLVVSSYDDYLSMIWVTLDFGEVQTRCSVLEKNISYCETPPEITPIGPDPQTTSPASPGGSSPLGSGQNDSSTRATFTPQVGIQSAETSSAQTEQTDKLANLNQYGLEITIDPEQSSFHGNLTLDYTNTENVPLDTLFFRLLPNGQRSYGTGSLRVNHINVAGTERPIRLSQEDTILEVELGKNLSPSDSIRVSISFQGQVPRDFGGGEDSGGYGIYNHTNDVMALASWYPILAVYDEKGWHLDPVSSIGDSVFSDIASYEVEINLPSNQVLVSTGENRHTFPEGGHQRYVIESGPVRDFCIVLSPHYQSLSSEMDGTLIRSFFLPEHQTGGQRALEIASKAVEIFNHQFGKYPYPEMDIVEAPMQKASGVEYPGIMLIGDFLYPEFDQIDFEVTVAHEIAHQWWYNLVGNDVFADPWLDEAMASYTSGLFLEVTRGKPGLMGLMNYYQQRYQRILDSGSDHPITESLTYFENGTTANAYGAIVYAKGALFLDAVRQEIGDRAFFAALHSYFQKFEYSIATSEDLLEAFEASAGSSLNDLYQIWNISP